MTLRAFCLAFAFALALGAAAPVSAAEATDDLTISATMAETCEVWVPQPFNGLDLTAAPWAQWVFSAEKVMVRCTLDTAYSIAPGTSENTDKRADYPGYRTLSNGAGYYAPYALFRDAAATDPWSEVAPVLDTGTGQWQGLPLAVRFYGLPKVVEGVYEDTIPMVLTYN